MTTRAKRSARIIGVAAAVAALVATPALADPHRSFGTAIHDAWITGQVKLRLIHKPGIPPLATNIDTEDGIVTLAGTVTTEDGKREAARQAELVAGVRGVHNELAVVAKKS